MARYIFILLFSTTLFSQSSFTWEPLPGPMGYNITSLYKTENDMLLAGTWKNAFRSVNHGRSWERTNIRDNTINTFFQHSSGRIFAGTIFGVYCSDNNAKNWRNVNTGLSNDYSQCFAENSNGHIFTGTIGRVAGIYYGVYRSIDLGETWIELNHGLDVYSVNQIIVDTSDVIYAATEKGLFYSLDDGNKWEQTNSVAGSVIYDLLYTKNYRIIAATNSGLYKFSRTDSIWINIGLDTIKVTTLCQDEYGNIYAGTENSGLFCSDSLGNNWHKYEFTNLYSEQINDIISMGEEIFVGTDNGIFIHDDSKEGWIQSGLRQTYIRHLSIHGENTLFAKNDYSNFHYMWYSNDYGENWNPISDYDLNSILRITNGVIYALTFHEILFSEDNCHSWQIFQKFNYYLSSVTWIDTNHIIVGGTENIGIGGAAVLLQTTDGGKNWENIWYIPGFEDIIYVQSNIDDGLYVAAMEEFNHSSQKTAIFYTKDYGGNWEKIIDLDYWKRIIVGKYGKVYITKDSEGILLFDNNFKKWYSLNKGLSTAIINSIIITRNDDLICTTNDGVYRFRESDSTWICISDGPNGVILKSIAEDNFGKLYVSTDGDGIYKSNSSYLTSITKNKLTVDTFQLFQNYPNPFNPTTKIKFSIGKADFVKISIYNILGQNVKTLINEFKNPGTYEVQFDATNLPSGIYYYWFESGSFTKVNKMIVLK